VVRGKCVGEAVENPEYSTFSAVSAVYVGIE
jgi:hypothetical protein